MKVCSDLELLVFEILGALRRIRVRSLNREWTRIAAVIKCGFISNDFSNSVGYEVMARDPRILAFFDFIRVPSRLFAVQN